MPQLYELKKEVILENYHKCYKQAITINKRPNAPLQSLVKQAKFEKASPFSYDSPCCPNGYNTCKYYVLDPNNTADLLCEENIANLFSFLIENGYTIETQLTEMMQQKNKNLICYIKEP